MAADEEVVVEEVEEVWKEARKEAVAKSAGIDQSAMYENILDRFVEGREAVKARHGKKMDSDAPIWEQYTREMAQLRDGIMDSATYETTVLREANDLARGSEATIQMIATLLRERESRSRTKKRTKRKKRKKQPKKAPTAVSKNTVTKWAMDHLVPLLTAASLPLEPWAGAVESLRDLVKDPNAELEEAMIPAVVEALTADENVCVSVNGSEERTGLALSCSLAVAERHGSMEMLLRLASTYLRLPATSVSSERPQLDAKDSMPACLRADPERASMP